MRRSFARDAGLTLVEALVSLFVFGLVSAGCMVMLAQGVASEKRVAEAHGALRSLDVARALLEGDMAQLVGRETQRSDGTSAPRFEGGEEDGALSFVRASAEPDPERGAVTSLAFVQYRIENGALVRVSRSYLDAVADTPEQKRTILARGDGARFEYFDGQDWVRQWRSVYGQPLPRAVALVATFPRYGEVRIEARVGVQP